MKTIYIERPLPEEDYSWVHDIASRIGADPARNPHVTLVYSKTQVDHAHPAFALQRAPMEVDLSKAWFERFGPAIVLRFEDPRLHARRDELYEGGAQSDFPIYQPHITVAYDYDNKVTELPSLEGIPKSQLLEGELMELVAQDEAELADHAKDHGFELVSRATFDAEANDLPAGASGTKGMLVAWRRAEPRAAYVADDVASLNAYTEKYARTSLEEPVEPDCADFMKP